MLSALKDSIPSLSMQHISSTSSISCSSHRSIEHVCQTLKMPLEAAQAFKAKGLDNLYLWQMECLLKTSVTQGKNLIYSAPTRFVSAYSFSNSPSVFFTSLTTNTNTHAACTYLSQRWKGFGGRFDVPQTCDGQPT